MKGQKFVGCSIAKKSGFGAARALKVVLGHKRTAGVSLLFSVCRPDSACDDAVSGSRWRMVIIWWEWTVLPTAGSDGGKWHPQQTV